MAAELLMLHFVEKESNKCWFLKSRGDQMQPATPANYRPKAKSIVEMLRTSFGFER